MAFSDYHFVTHWKIQGPIQIVYDILKDGARYDQWWKPSYVHTEEIAPKKIKSCVRAKLPYTLTFIAELVLENPPNQIALRSSGELFGTGLWKLRSLGETTEVEFYWDVQATKPLVRWFSFLLKPLFIWNHTYVMEVGQKCLQREVERSMALKNL